MTEFDENKLVRLTFCIQTKKKVSFFKMNGQALTREPPKILQTQWIQSTNDMLSVELAISSECYLSCTDYKSQCHFLYYFLHLLILGVDNKVLKNN